MTFGLSAKLSELMDKRALLEAALEATKKGLVLVNNEIASLSKPLVDAAFARHGEPSGTTEFAVDNRIFKAVIGKTVTWDQDALKDIAREMEFEDAHDYFKITYSMPEATYKSILAPSRKAQLTVARSVKYSEPKITLKE